MIRIAVALAAALMLTGCGAEQAASPSDPAGPTGDFVADDLPDPFGPDDQLRVTLSHDGVSFTATCNHMSGSTEVVDRALVVTGIGGTEMGCPGPGFAQDEWLVEFFSGSPELERKDPGFTLSDGDVTLRFLPAGDGIDQVQLEGTPWTLNGIEETDGDSVGFTTIPPEVEAGVTIEGGTMLVRTGCNRGRTEVTVLDEQLELGPLALTRMACSGPAGEVERGVLQVLDAPAVEWRIDGTQLRLTNGDRALVYDAE